MVADAARRRQRQSIAVLLESFLQLTHFKVCVVACDGDVFFRIVFIRARKRRILLAEVQDIVVQSSENR